MGPTVRFDQSFWCWFTSWVITFHSCNNGMKQPQLFDHWGLSHVLLFAKWIDESKTKAAFCQVFLSPFRKASSPIPWLSFLRLCLRCAKPYLRFPSQWHRITRAFSVSWYLFISRVLFVSGRTLKHLWKVFKREFTVKPTYSLFLEVKAYIFVGKMYTARVFFFLNIWL